ncbi:MAG: hypothetical protein Kow0092_09490 [Deferrisomatales bacterium]
MTSVREFQEVLRRVAATGKREEVDAELVPDVRLWDALDSRGCTISVEKGRWWVVPPGRPLARQVA